MKGYIIVDVTVHDAERMEAYKSLVPASLIPFDGKFVIRGGATEVLEGTWHPKRIVVLEFPSMEKAKAWWSSDEYEAAKAIRQAASDTHMIMVEGIS